MNAAQKRLLLETEYLFYKYQVTFLEFERILVGLGFKANPDISKLSDLSLQRLNLRLRSILRSTP